jgi:DNA-directed RNA polymerase delta subunit
LFQNNPPCNGRESFLKNKKLIGARWHIRSIHHFDSVNEKNQITLENYSLKRERKEEHQESQKR